MECPLLFNVLPPAVDALRSLCPQVPITINLFPQAQAWYSDEVYERELEPIETLGMIQTVTPSKNDVMINTINSGRQFRVYLTQSLGILSSQEYTPLQSSLTFFYNREVVEATTVGFSDYRYNGWLALFCVQSTKLLHDPRYTDDSIVT